jgi:uroporphyrinogen-III synthase
MSPTSPIAGRRVVVTRAGEQAEPLAALLASRGAHPVVVPLIELVDHAPGMQALDDVRPASFDWIVFTSANAARRGVAAGLVGGGGGPRVAAIGTATAAALPRADLVPHRQRAAGLIDEFPHGEGHVLVVQALDAQPTLVDGLRAKGWAVDVVTPYRAVPAVPPAGVQLAALAADAVLFASGSAARAWASVFGTSTPPIVVAIGPETAAAAEHAGLKVTVVATDHSLDGMVVALETSAQGAG